ncbi:MAG: OmpA family protein [Bdellovibrionales bacterium]|nr:OmpA family protein [Bdellovibrionales bacterium]
MSAEEPPKKKEGGGGAPLWMATFADLMSLLLAFFVLLFSFAEIKDEEFSRRGGEMAEALGVQTDTAVFYKVQGTNPAASEFSSEASKESAKLKIVQDFTAKLLRLISIQDKENGGEANSGDKIYGQKIEEILWEIKDKLSAEIFSGLVDVVEEDGEVIIRLHEKILFAPGSIEPLQEPWNPLARLHQVLRKAKGRITISGFTGKESLVGSPYRSLTDLSAARAASVAVYFLSHHLIDVSQLELAAFGDTKPLFTLGTPEELSQNRRVEISVTNLLFLEKKKKKKFVPAYLRDSQKELKMTFDPTRPGKVWAKFYPTKDEDDDRMSLEESLEIE